ncbi:MAG: VOC family protein [Methanolobus sp.]
MQKIVPHLWYDKEAAEAAEFYISIFSDSKIKNTTVIHDTPSGDAETVNIELAGQEFILLSGGPFFKLNPSISFLVACDTKDEVEILWEKLSEGGKPLMPLDDYPFSEMYGWIEDRYGVSWQIMYFEENSPVQKLTPTFMFTEQQCGKTEEAVNFYISVFKNTELGDILRYGEGEEPDMKGTIKHVAFTLESLEFAAMDSAQVHDFTFNEAISLVVYCENQKEVDYYWENLSSVPEAEQCGWLKDKFGVSWQIVPAVMEKMMQTGDAEKLARVTEAFLRMKKFDIHELEKAYGDH